MTYHADDKEIEWKKDSRPTHTLYLFFLIAMLKINEKSSAGIKLKFERRKRRK
jgi:hypothetical protein